MEQNTLENKTQIVYFSHGGGPLPILGDAGHKAMVEFMTGASITAYKTGCHPGHQRPLGRKRSDTAGGSKPHHVL